MDASVFAFLAAAAGVCAVVDLAPPLAPRVFIGRDGLRTATDGFALAGREGRDPATAERRRLLAGGSVSALGAGWVVFGPPGGLLAALVAPAIASRVLRGRRARYRAAVDAGSAEIAIALSDALSGGHSLRGSIVSASTSLPGAPGHELRRVAAELELGAATDDALEAMRRRVGSPGIDVIVAGALLQRRAGGDLAALLRTSARAFEDETRLIGEVKAVTAQARFTGLVVVLMPIEGAVVAGLGSPGFVAGLLA